eukprot:s389_g2.t2
MREGRLSQRPGAGCRSGCRTLEQVPQTLSAWLEHYKVRLHAKKFRSSGPANVLRRIAKHVNDENLQQVTAHLAYYLISLPLEDTLEEHQPGQSVVLLLIRNLEQLKSKSLETLGPWLTGLLGAISAYAPMIMPDEELRAALLVAMPKHLSGKKVQLQLDKAIKNWKVDLAASEHESEVAKLEEELSSLECRPRKIFRKAVAALAPPEVPGEEKPLSPDTRGLQRRIRRLALQCMNLLEPLDPRITPLLQHLRFLTDKVPETQEQVSGFKQWQRLRLKVAEFSPTSAALPVAASETGRAPKRPRTPGGRQKGGLCRRRKLFRQCVLRPKCAFGTHEVTRLLKGHELPDLMLAYPLFRETIRQCREQCPKEFNQDPEGTTILRFEEVLQHLPDGEDTRKLRRFVRGTFADLTGRKHFSFWRIFEECHFTNIFHRHDACNICVEQLRPILSFEAVLPVVVLIYHTGNRAFVRHIVAQVERRHRRGRLWDVSEHVSFWKAMLESYLERFTWQVHDKDEPLPELYHRRFRPMLLWNNQVRKHLSEARAATAGVKDLETVRMWMRDHALIHLQNRATVLMSRADELAGCRTYEALYGCLRQALADALPANNELDFHAKNLANLLEPWLPTAARDDESEANGLGPGFRQMAHICQGKGKQDGLLSRALLEAELADTTLMLGKRFPKTWAKPRKRHVQALYCELQKLFFFLRRGHPAVTFRRSIPAMSLRSLDVLARRKTEAEAPGRLRRRSLKARR